MTRTEQLTLIYRHTHKDYKGTIDGVRTLMVCRGGSCLVALDDLTDAEIADRLPAAQRREAMSIADIYAGRTSASWVIVRKDTGESICETFNPAVVAKLNRDKYEAVPILEWLQKINVDGTQ